MYYFAIRLCLTLLVETFIMRMSAHLLTMRSNKQYYLAELTYFFIWAPLKELPLPNFVRVLALLIDICIPIACSVGPLSVRLSREMLIQLLMVANEMIAVVVASALTGGEGAMGTPTNRGDLLPVIAAYAALISVYACETEALIALFTRLDHHPDADIEPPAFVMMLGSLGLIILVYYRLFGRGAMVTGALAVIMGYCVLSAVLGLLLITVAQRDARNKREMADQMAEARQTKHVRDEVEATTRRSMDLRRLRHDLANQMGVVTGLVAEGRYDDADRYLASLEAQARDLQGNSR